MSNVNVIDSSRQKRIHPKQKFIDDHHRITKIMANMMVTDIRSLKRPMTRQKSLNMGVLLQTTSNPAKEESADNLDIDSNNEMEGTYMR